MTGVHRSEAWLQAQLSREERIAKFRQAQPEAELERKWNKARGRHSNAFWTQEWLDLALRRADELYRKIKRLGEAP